jgi:hypothetical protein
MCLLNHRSLASTENEVTSKSIENQLRISIPLPVQGPEEAPLGFDPSEIGPPPQLRYSLQLPLNPTFGLIFDGNLAFTRSGFSPLFGVSPGVSFSFPALDFFVQLDAQNQTTVGKAPYANSQYDVFYWGPKMGISRKLTSILRAQLRGQFIFTQQTELANFESLQTLIDHNTTFVLSPLFTLHPIKSLELEASIDFFHLGATGIASKEFAFAIESQWVYRWNFGISYSFGDFIVRAVDSIVTGVKDSQAINYQAPYLSENYLLSKQVLKLEFVWKF